ncbi:MAG: hypothetical protein CM1200mP22_30560 [Dehalococcoidia bacterium]|nr:MAG: hypothetical protein CM1200mP22_30560 [Dehalococcoidia bacterium]
MTVGQACGVEQRATIVIMDASTSKVIQDRLNQYLTAKSFLFGRDESSGCGRSLDTRYAVPRWGTQDLFDPVVVLNGLIGTLFEITIQTNYS